MRSGRYCHYVTALVRIGVDHEAPCVREGDPLGGHNRINRYAWRQARTLGCEPRMHWLASAERMHLDARCQTSDGGCVSRAHPTIG